MRNIAVVLIAMTLSSVAFADDAQPAALKAAPETPATNSRSGKVNGQLVDSMSFEKLQAQMLASQEARLPLIEKEIELRYQTRLKVLGDPDSSTLLVSEFITLFFNKRRRAIHDFIGSTIVIQQSQTTVLVKFRQLSNSR